MINFLAHVRSFDRTVQLLLLNQFGINIGFYMLMPYLANYLSTRLLLAGWLVGLVLGARNLSQQGMFAISGSLADRFGYKPLILAGCALRVVGLALLGLVESVPMLIVAAIVTGLAGALFNPAVRAYLAVASGSRRVEAFALFNVFYQSGVLVGPLIGLALTVVDFRLTCLTAATVFAILTLLQSLNLPRRASPENRTVALLAYLLSSWRTVASSRAFLMFTAAMAGVHVLSFQLYLALPLAIASVAPSEVVKTAAVTAMFMTSALLVIFGQIKVTAWCRRRWSIHGSLVAGTALMGAAFLPMAAVAGLSLAVATVTVAVLSSALVTLAEMITYPVEMDSIVVVAGQGRVATYYGVHHTLSGLAIAVGNLVAGAALDMATERQLPAVPWIAFGALGALCAVMIHQLHLRGVLSQLSLAQKTTISSV